MHSFCVTSSKMFCVNLFRKDSNLCVPSFIRIELSRGWVGVRFPGLQSPQKLGVNKVKQTVHFKG